jgi:pyruvate dehydrogenase E2 component (dihydrolipoamide acetyltransferase)
MYGPPIPAGTLAAIHVQAGDVAPVGAVVAVIEGKGETVSLQKPPPRPTPAKAPQAQTTREQAGQPVSAKPAVPMEPFREVRSPERNYGPARLPGGTTVTPLARRLAGERGIDLAAIKGSGPHGRTVAADVESAKQPVAHAAALAAMPIVLTADVAVGQALALCSEANATQKAALEFADVVVKAWAAALARVMPSEHTGIALAIDKSRTTIADAAAKSLTAISAARRAGADGSASSAISIPAVAGITSVADVLTPPQTALLSLGAPRRAPVEAEDGSVKFISVMTVTLSCDHRVVDAALGAELLSTFKGFVEQPVTMIV